MMTSNYKLSSKDISVLNWCDSLPLVNFTILDQRNFIKLHFQNYFKLDTIPKKELLQLNQMETERDAL